MREPINPTQVYSTQEATKLVGVDRETLYTAIKSGDLRAKEIGRGYKIVGANLLAYAGSVTYSPQVSSSIPDTSGEQ